VGDADIWRMQASSFDDPLDDSPSPEEILRQLFKIEKCLGRSWQIMAAHGSPQNADHCHQIVIHVDKAVLPSFATASIELAQWQIKLREHLDD